MATEKIDGSNACIYIGEDCEFLVGSRNRWITPADDNYGFARWAHEHKEELLKLGPGRHYGEWWGLGIQRNYGLKEKRFSLFNVTRWCHSWQTPELLRVAEDGTEKYQDVLPECVDKVPVLWRGSMDSFNAEACLKSLAETGSMAAPGFMKPEGIVIFHTAANMCFKKTIDKDSEPKSKSKR